MAFEVALPGWFADLGLAAMSVFGSSGLAAWIGYRCGRRQARRRARETVDALTGLSDRAGFLRRARQVFAAPAEVPVAVLLIDVERLHAVNELHGYAMGDAMLAAVGRRLKLAMAATVCAGDRTLGRFYGDVFALAIAGLDHKAVGRFAERLREEGARVTRAHGGALLTVAVAVGTAMRSRGQDLAAVLLAAERALSEAKSPSFVPPHPITSSRLDPSKYDPGRDRAVLALRRAARSARSVAASSPRAGALATEQSAG